MAMLQRIQVKGFKSIREMDLELRPLNVLIGANGSGKSNFLSIFKFMNQIALGNLQGYVSVSGGADTFLYFGRGITNRLDIALRFDRLNYETTLLPTLDDTLKFDRESFSITMPSISFTSSTKGYQESVLRQITHSHQQVESAELVLQHLESLRLYHFHDPLMISKTSDVGDNLFLRPDGSNVSAILYLMRLKERFYYDRVVDIVRRVAPFFEDFNLRPNRDNREKIRLEWREKGTDAYRPGYLLSDGTLRFICLATLLLQAGLPSTILIDEPELGLHPHAIILLAAMLKSVAATNQIIISTQSVTLANQFISENIIVVDREPNTSTFKRLNAAEISHWLDDYAIGELWEQNVIGGTP